MCRACTMQVPSVEIPISLERLSTPCHPSTGPSDVLTRALCLHSIIKKNRYYGIVYIVLPPLFVSLVHRRHIAEILPKRQRTPSNNLFSQEHHTLCIHKYM